MACISSFSVGAQQLVYPETEKGNVVDTYFGTPVPDPYRWLEDDLSEKTAKWVAAQNAVTFGYLDKIPFRKDVQERITQLWNYEKRSAPTREGSYLY